MGGINWEVGNDKHILLYVKQITYKDLWYSTGNSIQYGGKNLLRKDICKCIHNSVL